MAPTGAASAASASTPRTVAASAPSGSVRSYSASTSRRSGSDSWPNAADFSASIAFSSPSSGLNGRRADRPEDQVHHDEDAVDDREGGLEEVVDVSGDELAELVDEPPEARTTEERRDDAPERSQVRDRDHDRDRHHQGAPDRVRDVERAVAELWVAGDDEEDAVPEHRGHGHDHEDVEAALHVGAAEGETGCQVASAHAGECGPPRHGPGGPALRCAAVCPGGIP